jgi:hypothetical protein
MPLASLGGPTARLAHADSQRLAAGAYYRMPPGLPRSLDLFMGCHATDLAALNLLMANGGTREGNGRGSPLLGNHSRTWRREGLTDVYRGNTNSLVRQSIVRNHRSE